MKKPHSLGLPRVPRSPRDDFYVKAHPMCPKLPGVGIVLSIEDDTATVLVSEEEIAGAIPLGNMPPVDSIVEVESRCDLMVILDYAPDTYVPPVEQCEYPATFVTPVHYPGNFDDYQWEGPEPWITTRDDLTSYVDVSGMTSRYAKLDFPYLPGIGQPLEIVVRYKSNQPWTNTIRVDLVPSAPGSVGYAASPLLPASADWTEATWVSSQDMPDGAFTIYMGFIPSAPASSDLQVTYAALVDDCAPALMAATAEEAEPTERTRVATADWVHAYAGDGSQISDLSASQGVTDRDDHGEPVVDGRGHEASLVGFAVDLPDDADVRNVRLRTSWPHWYYANGIGALALGWHDHDDPPEQWSPGAGAVQLSDVDVRADQLVDVVLDWAPAVVGSGQFRGLTIGPGLNDGGLYAGHSDAALADWSLVIRYWSSTEESTP